MFTQQPLLAELPGTVLPVLLYDGQCGLCAASIEFILRHEGSSESAKNVMHFASLQGRLGDYIRGVQPALSSVDSIIWIGVGPKGHPTVLIKSDAVLAVLRHVAGVWSLPGRLGRVIPRRLRDMVYDMIAQRRYRLTTQRCLLPENLNSSRFLD